MQQIVITEFWSHHGITSPRGAVLAEPAIYALHTAHPIFASAFNDAPEPKETSGLIRCAIENLSNRLYEQAAGMLVCLGTRSAAAAETVARTVIEGAFNLQFIASKDHEARLFAFFYHYLQEHSRKLSEWQKLEQAESPTPRRSAILKSIADRVSTHEAMADFVKGLGKGFGYERPAAVSQFWPTSLFKRCEQLAKAGDYLTSYHRLSASSHINAEETIRWLFGIHYAGIGHDERLPEKLSLETVSFSAMMTRIAVFHYIEASSAACRALNTKYDEVTIGKTTERLCRSIQEIAASAGTPV